VKVEAKVDSEAREEEFRDALTQAWIAYCHAPTGEKDEALQRYRALLEEFTRLVMPYS